jgi:Flp pilus assembly protein TadG
MSRRIADRTWAPGRVASFLSSTRAAAAVEFALVALPFFMFVLCILQLGVYYFAQSALDTGVLKTAQTLYSGFRTGTSAYTPSAGTLKAAVSTNSGGMIQNGSGLAVEIQPMSNLSGGSVPITDGVNNYGTTTSTLVLRAQANVITFAPGFSTLAVATSSAIVRRQGT